MGTRGNQNRPVRGGAHNKATLTHKGKVKGSNREVVLFLFFGLMAIAIVAQLFNLQVLEAQAYSEQARWQRSGEARLEAKRGTIYDRNGIPLAMSVDATNICANLDEIENPSATAAILAEELGGDQAYYYEQLTQGSVYLLEGGVQDETLISSHMTYMGGQLGDSELFSQLAAMRPVRSAVYIYIQWRADVEEADRLKARNTELQEEIDKKYAALREEDRPATALYGIHYEATTKRVYPYGQIGAQVIGSVDSEGVGVSGLELTYNSVLCGSNGSISTEWAQGGVPIPGVAVERVDPVDGEDIIISIDIDFQAYVESELLRAGEEGNCNNANTLVLDSGTGEIYAAASLPLYDRENLNEEAVEQGAMVLKGVTTAYEPGSTFKIPTAVTALELGVVTPEEELFVPAYLPFYSDGFYLHSISDAHQRGDEIMSFAGIIKQSSNVGASLIKERIDNYTFESYLRTFGFGGATHIDYPGESFGVLAPAEDWGLVQAANISFGQGVSVSSLQLVSFYGAIVNDGIRVQPHFLLERPQAQTSLTYKSERLMSSETAGQMTDIMVGVVADGTGRYAQIDGYTVAGKTGTAEKASEEGGYIGGEYIVSFAGFLAYSDSKLVCITSMDNPIGATTVAPTAPLYASIMGFAAEHYMITPDVRVVQEPPAESLPPEETP